MAKSLREDFGKQFSCPAGRVDVTLRADVDPVAALAPGQAFDLGTPPAEVKNDPERYARWKEDQAANRAVYARDRVFAVSGCGHRQLLACHAHHRGAAVFPGWPDCTEISDPDAGADAGAAPLALADLATASIGSPQGRELAAPPIVGGAESFDPVENYGWASSIATAWSPGASLIRLQVLHLPKDGACNLLRPLRDAVVPCSVVYTFLGAGSGVALDLTLDVPRQRPAAAAVPGAARVMVRTRSKETGIAYAPIPRPRCTVPGLFAAVSRAASIAPSVTGGGYDANLWNDRPGGPRWYLSVAVRAQGGGIKGLEYAVSATSCAVEGSR